MSAWHEDIKVKKTVIIHQSGLGNDKLYSVKYVINVGVIFYVYIICHVQTHLILFIYYITRQIT